MCFWLQHACWRFTACQFVFSYFTKHSEQFKRFCLQHIWMVNKTSSFKTKLIGNNAKVSWFNHTTLWCLTFPRSHSKLLITNYCYTNSGQRQTGLVWIKLCTFNIVTCYGMKTWHLVVASNKAIKKFRLSAVQELGIKLTIRCVYSCGRGRCWLHQSQ